MKRPYHRFVESTAPTEIRIRPLKSEYPRSLRAGRSKACMTCIQRNSLASGTRVSNNDVSASLKKTASAASAAKASITLMKKFFSLRRRWLTTNATTVKSGTRMPVAGSKYPLVSTAPSPTRIAASTHALSSTESSGCRLRPTGRFSSGNRSLIRSSTALRPRRRAAPLGGRSPRSCL
jgi:hypothetical protein